MKIIVTTISVIVLFISCKESTSKQTSPAILKDSTMAAKTVKKDFGNIEFASKKDMSCGMPLTAGLEDTAHYKGKVYGFCSAECKADFVKNAAQYVK